VGEVTREEYWAVAFDANEPDERRPSFYFWLNLLNLTPDQTRRVRGQAETVVGKYAESERAVVIETYRAIVEIATIRLRSGVTGPPASSYLVRVAADVTDPIDQLRDDRGTVLSWALKYRDDPDPAVAKVWETVAKGFNQMFFVRPESDG
jgi:hypothetical protein